MPRSYLPSRESSFVTWINDFNTNLADKPANYFGVSAQVIAEYDTTVTRFMDAYAAASNPDTRTRPNIEAKSMAKKTLVTNPSMIYLTSATGCI